MVLSSWLVSRRRWRRWMLEARRDFLRPRPHCLSASWAGSCAASQNPLIWLAHSLCSYPGGRSQCQRCSGSTGGGKGAAGSCGTSA
jgi:hypothetical protein